MTSRSFPFSPLTITRALCACCLFCGYGGAFATATQQAPEPQSLTVGSSAERELTGGQTHVYRITLSAGQFALVQVEQRGAEIVLTAHEPDGKEFALVDLRIGAAGAEPVAIIAEAPGEYLLKITFRNPKAAAGRYEAKLSELRLATAQDRARLKAQALCYAAEKFSRETNPEAKRQAVKLYEEALPLWQQVPEPSWEAGLLWRLGRLHNELTEFARAKNCFQRSVSNWRALGDRHGEVAAQNGVCEALNFLGDAKGRSECLDAVIAVHRELGNRLDEARASASKASALNSTGDYQTALHLAQQALRVFEAEKDRVQESYALNVLGHVYRSLNEHQLALEHYERALAIRRQGSDRRRLGLTLGDMGVTYFDLGDFPRALDFFNQALAISDELGDRRTKAIRLQSLGVLYDMMGETAKALDAQTQSLALARAVGDRNSEGRTLIALSDLHLTLGEKEKAGAALNQALELARSTDDPVGEAAALRKSGRLAAKNGGWQKAIDLVQQALALARATGDLRGERDALINLAQTEREHNNFSEARHYHEKILTLTESLRAKIFNQELRASYLASRQGEYELYTDLLMQMHQRQPDAGHAAAAFEISERGRARSLLETLIEARADIRQGADANLLAAEQTLVDRIRALEQQRTKLIGNAGSAKQTEVLDKELGDLLAEYQVLQGRIRAVSPRYAALTQPQPVTAAEIQTQHLDGDTVLLEFALGTDRSWMWAVTPGAALSFELPPRQEIEAATRKFYELLTARQPVDNESSVGRRARVSEADGKLETQAQILSRMLLRPVAHKLNSEWQGKRLLVVAAGALEYLPFAALPVPAGAEEIPDKYHPLIADHEVVNLPSASVLAVIRRESAERQQAAGALAVIADPVFEASDPRAVLAAKKKTPAGNSVARVRSAENSPALIALEPDWARAARSFNPSTWRSGFSRLPFSREEADGITALMPAAASFKATDFEASRAQALSGELGRYRLVHFATHGLLNSHHPELSGLVLSLVDADGRAQDGFLRMHEIYNLRLPAEVVVLSACQTALGKEIRGEGLVGLTRGFMYAGAQRVVASLWQVDDLATAELMKRFYRGMLKDGMRPAAALRAAQVEMMKQQRWSAPYYWAAFVVQGEYR